MILAAAEAIFAERGFAAARLEDVADRVGIRRASVVYYYRTKQDLYDAVLGDVIGEMVTRFRAVVTSPVSLRERVEAAVAVWVAYVGERPSIARILLREVAEASPTRRSAARHLRPAIAAVADAIREAQRAGHVEPIDPIHFIFTIVGATLFFVVATPTLAPDWPLDPLGRDQFDAHRAIVREITTRLLGADVAATAAE